MRLLLTLLLAPLLLAPVRLKDATPSFFTPPAQGPAPESYSLPPAEPLITPTVIRVSPTILPDMSSPTAPAALSPLTLPLTPTPTTPPVQKVIVIQQPANAMSARDSALCQRAMILVQELAMLSYQQKPNQRIMTLTLASSAAAAEARGLNWPNLAAFNEADDHMPWFQPQKAELRDATTAARRLCSQQ